MTTTTEGYPDGLRLRLWIGGKLADETWITQGPGGLAASEATAARHGSACVAADEAGVAWLLEVFDPDAPEDSAYLRFGTDEAGMVCPVPYDGDLRDLGGPA